MLLILEMESCIKSLLGTTCGLNNLSKQIYLLRCFISHPCTTPSRYLMIARMGRELAARFTHLETIP
jgi:hypothetical protein